MEGSTVNFELTMRQASADPISLTLLTALTADKIDKKRALCKKFHTVCICEHTYGMCHRTPYCARVLNEVIISPQY